MTTPRRSAGQTDNMMLILGQVVEGVKAASEGLRGLGDEVRQNAATIITLSNTVKMLEEVVKKLEFIIHDSRNDKNLSDAIGSLESDLDTIRKELDTLILSSGTFKTRLDAHDTQAAENKGRHSLLLYIGAGLLWATTTAIAIYAAMGQWAAVKEP